MKVSVELVGQTRRILHVTTKLLYSRTRPTIPRYICICVPLKRRPMLNLLDVINSFCKAVLIRHVSVFWLSHTFSRSLSCSVFQDGSDDVKDSSTQIKGPDNPIWQLLPKDTKEKAKFNRKRRDGDQGGTCMCMCMCECVCVSCV